MAKVLPRFPFARELREALASGAPPKGRCSTRMSLRARRLRPRSGRAGRAPRPIADPAYRSGAGLGAREARLADRLRKWFYGVVGLLPRFMRRQPAAPSEEGARDPLADGRKDKVSDLAL